jgi:hypothetical protein
MSTLASLNVMIGGNSVALRKELTRTSKRLQEFSKNARNNINKYGKAGVVAGGLVVGSLLAIYKQQATVIDQTAKYADSIGIQTSALTELRHAAGLSGISVKDLDKSVENLTRRVADAAFKGTGPLKDTLDALKIDVNELNKLKPDQQLGILADALSEVSSQSERTRIAYELFGRSGIGMLKLLEGGSAGLNAMRNEAQQLGLSLNRIDANKIEMANDNIARAESVWGSFSQHLATEAAPVIGSLAELFLENAKQVGGMGSYAADTVGVLVKGAGFVGNAWRGIQVIWQGLKVSFQGLKLLTIEGLNLMSKAYTAFAEGVVKTVILPLQKALDLAGYLNDDAATLAADLRELTTFKPIALFDEEQTNKAYIEAREATAKLHELMLEPIPAQNIDAWYAEVKARFDSLAQTYVSGLNYNTGNKGGDDDTPTKEQANPYAAQIKQAQEYYAVRQLMRENDWTEEKAQLQVQLNEYAEANAARKLTDDEYRLLSKQATELYQADQLEQHQGFLAQLQEQVQLTSENFDAMWGNTFDRFTQGVGESVANAVMTQQNFADSMRTVLSGVVRSTIAALAEMGAKRLALWAIEKVINKGTAIAASTTLSTGAQAMAINAGLNAFAATSAIPVVGPILAPGAMTAALAIAQPMAATVGAISQGMVGMAHSGIDTVPKEGTWLLDKGERVYTNESAEKLDRMYEIMANQSAGSRDVHISPQFNISAMDTSGFEDWYQANRNRIATDMQELIDQPL